MAVDIPTRLSFMCTYSIHRSFSLHFYVVPVGLHPPLCPDLPLHGITPSVCFFHPVFLSGVHTESPEAFWMASRKYRPLIAPLESSPRACFAVPDLGRQHEGGEDMKFLVAEFFRFLYLHFKRIVLICLLLWGNIVDVWPKYTFPVFPSFREIQWIGPVSLFEHWTFWLSYKYSDAPMIVPKKLTIAHSEAFRCSVWFNFSFMLTCQMNASRCCS